MEHEVSQTLIVLQSIIAEQRKEIKRLEQEKKVLIHQVKFSEGAYWKNKYDLITRRGGERVQHGNYVK